MWPPFALMDAWQRQRIDLTKLLKNAVGYCFKCGSMLDPFPLTSLADLAELWRTVVPFHPKHAQWVKDRVKLLAMVTNQHFAVSDSHALLAQHVVERCPAER